MLCFWQAYDVLLYVLEVAESEISDVQRLKFDMMLLAEPDKAHSPFFSPELLLKDGAQFVSCAIFQSELDKQTMGVVTIHVISDGRLQ